MSRPVPAGSPLSRSVGLSCSVDWLQAAAVSSASTPTATADSAPLTQDGMLHRVMRSAASRGSGQGLAMRLDPVGQLGLTQGAGVELAYGPHCLRFARRQLVAVQLQEHVDDRERQSLVAVGKAVGTC